MTIFETSFEVCNPVGGIHTVVSSKAPTLLKEYENVYMFGPLLEHSYNHFTPSKTLLKKWKDDMLKKAGIKVEVGYWDLPCKPVTILVDFSHLWEKKDEIYGHFWEEFGVQSHAAVNDYDQCAMFGYAVGQAMESLYHFLHKEKPQDKDYIAQFHEWQTAFGLLYLKDKCRPIRTVFTTHATGIGRSIAFNNKPLYDCFEGFNGDQMANELGFVSKHSVEKTAAHQADCFTTVSDGMARECQQLLEKKVDVVTPNGFNSSIVTKGEDYDKVRANARKLLQKYARSKGIRVTSKDTLVCISGRAEWKNKGIDIFLHAIEKLDYQLSSKQRIIAFVLVPYLYMEDRVYNNTTVLFVSDFLDGTDPFFKVPYYDLLIGMDLTVFPSYYEPWGYTPLESIAFHVPTITTSLAGFGQWALAHDSGTIEKGVEVVERHDSNYWDVVEKVVQTILKFLHFSDKEKEQIAQKANKLAVLADWSKMFVHYKEAYKIALKK